MSPFRVFMFTSMWLMFYQDRDIVIWQSCQCLVKLLIYPFSWGLMYWIPSAWGMPLVITSIALLVEQYSPKHDGFKMFLSTQYTDQRDVTGINIYYYVWLEYELFIGTIVGKLPVFINLTLRVSSLICFSLFINFSLYNHFLYIVVLNL